MGQKDKVYKNFYKSIIRDITTFGGTPFYIALTVFLLLINQSNAALDLLIAFIIIMAVSIISRMIHFKERPKKESYSSFVGKMEASSFPSVHSARSFFLATYFAQFFNTTQTWILLITAATFVAWSRIKLKKHDLADVSAGAILGTLTTYLLIYLI